jgi:hypothetical protein
METYGEWSYDFIIPGLDVQIENLVKNITRIFFVFLKLDLK